MSRNRILNRRSIRIKGYDYAAAGGYYVTLNAFRRGWAFGVVVDGEMRLSPLGEIARECWQAVPEHFPNAALGEFMIMPDQMHGIIFLFDEVRAVHASPKPRHAPPRPQPSPGSRPHGPDPHSLGALIGSFKSAVTYRAHRELDSTIIWQRNNYEHIIRNLADQERIAAYILANPANWNKKKLPARRAPLR